MILLDTNNSMNEYSEMLEKQCMQYDSIMLQSNSTSMHGGLFNTDTSCNLTVHPALECQVSNLCYNNTRLTGLGDSVGTLYGVYNTYYALVSELDNSYILMHHSYDSKKQYASNLHEPHGFTDSFSISIYS